MISRNLPVFSRNHMPCWENTGYFEKTSFFLANPAPSRFVYFTAKNLRSQSLVWTRQKVDPNGLATPFQRGSRLSQPAGRNDLTELSWPLSAEVVWVIVHERVGRNITFHFQPSGVPKFLARHLTAKKEIERMHASGRTAVFRQSSSMCTCRDPMV